MYEKRALDFDESVSLTRVIMVCEAAAGGKRKLPDTFDQGLAKKPKVVDLGKMVTIKVKLDPNEPFEVSIYDKQKVKDLKKLCEKK